MVVVSPWPGGVTSAASSFATEFPLRTRDQVDRDLAVRSILRVEVELAELHLAVDDVRQLQRRAAAWLARRWCASIASPSDDALSLFIRSCLPPTEPLTVRSGAGIKAPLATSLTSSAP